MNSPMQKAATTTVFSQKMRFSGLARSDETAKPTPRLKRCDSPEAVIRLPDTFQIQRRDCVLAPAL
jgi:hypothetical protein